MSDPQLITGAAESAALLHRLTGLLDPADGWYGVFAGRDPEGLRACLDGTEIPPWDVVEALLYDLAVRYGPKAAERERPRAAAVHAAAAAAHDRRPGGRAALRERIRLMAGERERADRRRTALLDLLGRAVPGSAEAAGFTRELVWVRDDLARAEARTAELTARLTALGPAVHPSAAMDPAPARPDTVSARHSPAAMDPAPAGHSSAAMDPAPASHSPAAMDPAPAHDPYPGLATGSALRAPSPYSGPGAVPSVAGDPGPDPAFRAPGSYTGPDVRKPAWAPGPYSGPDATEPARAPGSYTLPPVAGEPGPFPAGLRAPGPGTAPPGAREPAPVHPDTGPGTEPSPVGEPPAAPVPVEPEAPVDPARHRARRRGRAGRPRGARYAWLDEVPEEPDPYGSEVEAAGPAALLGAPVTATAAPRGARFAPVVPEEAPPAPRPDPGPARQAVAALRRLRAGGRGGEAHALLCEAAAWPAELVPPLAGELGTAGLAADWATLLWEAASLPSERIAELGRALADAGRDRDAEALLRQGVARPTDETAAAVLALEDSGRTAHARALLDAFVGCRPAEEAARLAAYAPHRLVPLLLDAARAAAPAAPAREEALVHALRVSGLAG
ncbi:hypothetical protein [Streptomyces lichenis]|uniref:UL36 very large tegument protein n=1 Tax=Streptomyces lichenis TaxID=2306967 RepID=A0ABT0IBQ4_9ACTN|nr:hypothetical protein [Streptomyces lichenis]MCK8678743.1 hypothetical protein [Streptomyces lichenis]